MYTKCTEDIWDMKNMNSFRVMAMAGLCLLSGVSVGLGDVLIDFQNSASYDNNTTTQTFGAFRDVVSNPQTNRTNGGSGTNYFLRMSGSASPSTVYDLTPDTNTNTTFAVGIGQTLSLSMDYRFVLTGTAPTAAGQRNGGLIFGFYNAAGGGTNTGIGGLFNFDFYTGTSENNGYRYLNDLSTGAFGLIGSNTSMGDLSDAAYRLQLDYTNLSATTGQITMTIYSLTGLEGTVISQIASRAAYTFTYGTGSTQLNLDPNNVSLFLRGNLNSGVAEDIDRFAVVPEPSVLGLLGVALVGGLFLRRTGVLRARRA